MPGERNFLCWPLEEGVLFAGHFTSVISMISCAVAFAVFFRESAEDGHSRLLSFGVSCYAIFYLFMSRSLIRGVKDERRDKFIGWIAMSVITVSFLLAGSTFVLIHFFTGNYLGTNFITFTLLASSVLCSFVAGLLVYCIWGVVSLWQLYGRGNVQVEPSSLNGMPRDTEAALSEL